MRKVLRPKDDPNYRIVLDYCENIDHSTLANSLRLLDLAHTVQVAWRMLLSLGMKVTKAFHSNHVLHTPQ
jgi:hypothetical protein